VRVHIPLIQSHILRHKCLQMEDLLAAHLTSMFVERRPFNDLRLQRIVRFRYKFPRKRLDDGRRVDAMRQEIVKRGADL